MVENGIGVKNWCQITFVNKNTKNLPESTGGYISTK